MSLKSHTTIGPIESPPVTMIHAEGGVGKTTFAASMPRPYFFDCEKSSLRLNVSRCTPSSFVELYAALVAFLEEDHEYRTCVLDTLDWAEKLAIKRVFEQNDITSLDEISHGGAYVKLDGKILQLYEILNAIHSKGIAICILSHNIIKPYVNPTGRNYDKIMFKTQREGTGKLFSEWAEVVGYLHIPVIVSEDRKDMKGFAKKTTTTTLQKVVLSCAPNAAYEAKNKFGIISDINIPPENGWNELEKAIKGEI